MAKSKKKFFGVVVAVAVLGALGGGYLFYQYSANNPVVVFAISKGSPACNNAVLDIAFHDRNGIPSSESAKKRILEISEWNDETRNDIIQKYENNLPMNIDVNIKVENGKTIIKYFGFGTMKNGEKVDYKQEKVFDFVLVPDEKLPKSASC